MKNIFYIFALSVVFLLPANSAAADTIYPTQQEIDDLEGISDWTRGHYPERIAEFKKNPIAEGDTVFIGNSITEAGDWPSYFNNSPRIKNRGISGDMTNGLLIRLQEIIHYKPAAVYLKIGVNDMWTNRTPETIAGNIIEAAEKIKAGTPLTRVIIQTILPTSSAALVSKIKETNDILKKNAAPDTYEWLNTHVLFADAKDLMRSEFTSDGVHLSQAGYELWLQALKCEFVRGADISWISEMEAQGKKFYDKEGTEKDIFRILKELDINSVRFRVWVNPSNGYNSKDDVLAKSIRAHNAGMKLMIDFHYSDTWADPSHQTTPVAWTDYTVTQRAEALYNYTHDVLTALKNAGIYPEWVQVGNETNMGMLWPTGKVESTEQWDNYCTYLTSGYDAVKAASPDSKVIIHISNGYDRSLFKWHFDEITARNVPYDVIGMSHYPSKTDWEEKNVQLEENIGYLFERYGKPVMVTEIGMNTSDEEDCRNMIVDLISRVDGIADNNGLGVFYWEPQAYGMKYGKIAWHDNGRPTLAMDGFTMTTVPETAVEGNNLLKNGSLESDFDYWEISGMESIFKLSSWVPDIEGCVKSLNNNYWEQDYPVEGRFSQTITGIEDGEYYFSLIIASENQGTTSPELAMLAIDGEGNQTIMYIPPGSGSWITHSLPVNVTGNQCTVSFYVKDQANSKTWYNVSGFKFYSLDESGIVETGKDAEPVVFNAFSYPGETDIYVNIQFPAYKEEITLQLFDMQGRLCDSRFFRQINGNTLYKLNLNAKTNNAGIYLIRLVTDDNSYTLKMVK